MLEIVREIGDEVLSPENRIVLSSPKRRRSTRPTQACFSHSGSRSSLVLSAQFESFVSAVVVMA
jgi:hypothetical protein